MRCSGFRVATLAGSMLGSLAGAPSAAAQPRPAGPARAAGESPAAPAVPFVRRDSSRQAPRERRHRFGYGVLALHDQVRDDLLAPLRWSGPGAGLRLAWDYERARDRHGLALVVPLAALENRFGHAGYGLAAGAEYAYAREVYRGRTAGSVGLGGRARWSMYGGYYEGWDEEHLYWLTSSSIGPQVTWGREFGRRVRLAADASVPVVALVSRPPQHRLNKIDDLTRPSFYFTATHRDSRFTGLPKYAALQAGASTTVGQGRQRLLVRYDLDAASYARPARIVRVSNRLTVGHQVGF